MFHSRRIRTLLYNDQTMEASELDLLHTPSFQRLYGLHQLGFTDRVYIDASHSRLHHTIGVLEQVEKLIHAIRENLNKKPNRKLEYRDKEGNLREEDSGDLALYVAQKRRSARLMGLLHDLTHAPFGHTLEDEIELEHTKHDNPNRQADAYYLLLCEYIAWLGLDEELLCSEASGFTHGKYKYGDNVKAYLVRLIDEPSLVQIINDEDFIESMAKFAANMVTGQSIARRMSRYPAGEELGQLFGELMFAMRGLLYLDALHKDAIAECDEISTKQYSFEKLIKKILQLASMEQFLEPNKFYLHKDAFFLDVIGNTICADLLDYAKRDSFLSGMKLDYDADRIVENFTLAHYYPEKVDRAKEPMLRTAISIFSHKLRLDVPGELINLLQIRFYVYQRMLFHPTKCTAGAMLGSALQLIGWNSLPSHFRHVDDSIFLYEVGEAAKLFRNLLMKSELDSNDSLQSLRYVYRQLYKLPLNGITKAVISLVIDWRKKLLACVKQQLPVVETNEIIHRLQAGIRLLNRIHSRRYYRPIFQLLPNIHVDELNVGPDQVAETFLNAQQRFDAERAIEKECGLPLGGAVIHCPTSKGPQKIANILILSEKESGEIPYKLREIEKVDKEIFHKHQEAVLALEEMYASMWRLNVNIIPSRLINYQEYSEKIGQVLFNKLAQRDSSEKAIPNDKTMLKELEFAKKHSEEPPMAENVYFNNPDGSIGLWNVAELHIAEAALPFIREYHPEIYDLALKAAAEGTTPPDITTLLSEIFSGRSRSKPKLATETEMGETGDSTLFDNNPSN